MRINNKSLFGILQVALGLRCINNDLVDGFEDEEWREIFSFVSQQGVSAIALLGIENFGMKPPHSILMKWIGVKLIVQRNFLNQQEGCRQLVALCKEERVNMLVLKGMSLTDFCPDPSIREFGDLDVFSFPKGKAKVDFRVNEKIHDSVNRLVEGRGFAVEYWDMHDVFNYGSVHVEHHSYFVNKNSKSGRRINEVLMGMVSEEKCIKVVDGLYYPSHDFNAIYLLVHTIGHMSYEGATLKNVLDYGMFLMHYGEKVNWNDVISIFKETGWTVGFNTLVRVVEKVLDVNFSCYYIGQPNEELSVKVLNLILETRLHQEVNLSLIKRVVMKTRRLFSHKWMYDCGLIPANFWTECLWGSVKEHLVRPSQI